MRVLVVSAAFPPMASGESTNAYHLSQQLARSGLDVHVLTSRGLASDAGPGITVYPVMKDWSWSSALVLRRVLRTCAPDVVYLMYLGWTYDYQFMSTFIPTIARQAVPDALIVTRFENVGGARPESNSLPSRLVRKAIAALDRRRGVDYQFGTLLRDSDSIVLLSTLHEPFLERHQPGIGRKCILIPPPVNMCLSADTQANRLSGRQRLGIQPEEFVLAYIGFVYPGKGLETLLNAFQSIADRSLARLVIIGGGLAREFPDQPSYLETLQSLADRLGIAGRVIWTGEYRWDDDRASTYLRAADVCVLPFDTGVKLNNSSFSSAAAHALPIVTTTHDLLEPQFKHGANVFLCQPRDPRALVVALETVMQDSLLRARLSEGACRLAQEWYSWPSAIARTIRLFESRTPDPRVTAPVSVGSG